MAVTRRRGLAWFSVTAAFVAGGLVPAWTWAQFPRKPFGTIAREAPFLAERYSAPFGDDYAATMRIVGALGAAGREGDAARLKDAWERAQLKRFLGEPHARAATLEAAIHAEGERAEPIRELRRRALGRVSLTFLQPLEAGSISRQRTRMLLSNALAVPVTRITFSVPLGGDYHAAYHCKGEAPTAEDEARIARAQAKFAAAAAKPVSRSVKPPPEHAEVAAARRELQLAIEAREARPIAAGASAPVTCNEWSKEAFERLSEPGRAWTPSVVHPAPYLVSETVVLPFGTPDFVEEGRQELERADCSALMTCEEVARRRWGELDRRKAQIGFALVVMAASAGFWIASRRLAVRPRPPIDIAAIGATGIATLASLFQFLLFCWVLSPHVGLVVLAFAGVVPIVAALVQAAAAALLAAIMARRREQLTRFRTFIVAVCLLMVAPIAIFLAIGIGHNLLQR